VRLFTAAQFRLNSSVNKIIEKAPFNIIYRYKLEMRINIAPAIKGSFSLREAPAARQKVKLRKKIQNIVKKYYDARRKDIFFTVGKEILFNIKNLRLRKPCKKLTDHYIGSFKIIKAVGLNTY